MTSSDSPKPHQPAGDGAGPRAEDPNGRVGSGFLGPFLVLAGLAFAFCALRAVLDGRPLDTAVWDVWFRSLVGGSLAGAAAFTWTASWRAKRGGPGIGPSGSYLTGWIVPGVAFSCGTAITALLTVPGIDGGLTELGSPSTWVAWALIAGFGGSVAFAVGCFYWAFATWSFAGHSEETGAHEVPTVAGREDSAAGKTHRDPSGPGIGGGPLKWIVTAAVLVGLVARVWGDRVEEQDRQRTLQIAEDVSSGAVFGRVLESAATPGTPVPAYADSVARWLRMSRGRWYGDPLTHRIDPPLGSRSFEVVFRDGRVESFREVEEPPGEDSIPRTEAAERLGLPAHHPVFRLEELDPTPPIPEEEEP